MSKVIALVNQKGGVGKTTTTAHLAWGLAKKGKKVLAIDLDPQGNLSLSMGAMLGNEIPSVVDWLEIGGRSKPFDDIAQSSFGVDLILADILLDNAETSSETSVGEIMPCYYKTLDFIFKRNYLSKKELRKINAIGEASNSTEELPA